MPPVLGKLVSTKSNYEIHVRADDEERKERKGNKKRKEEEDEGRSKKRGEE